jgi:hypothetical protein
MANQLSVLLNHIVSVFEADPLVNTIVFKDDDTTDVEKENIYPLVTIRLLASPAPDQNFRAYALSVEVLNQRDDTKTATPSKLLTDTNYIDNVGVCDSIANNFIMEILKTHNNFDINIIDDSITDFEPVKKDDRNMLDGVIFQCTFSIHQNDI